MVPAYQYAYLYNEAALNNGEALTYSFEDFEAYRNQTDPYGHPDVDWFNTILKDRSLMSNYNLNISGGGSTARYSVGLSYLNQEGLFIDNNPNYNTNAQVQRYTINTNIDVDITKSFNASLQLFGKIQDGNQPGGGTNNIISSLYTTPNNAYPIFNPDGSLGGAQNFSRNLYGMVNNSGYIIDYNRDIVANLVLTYKFDKFVKGLWGRAQSNLSVYHASAVNRSANLPSFKLMISPVGDSSYNRFGSSNSDQSNSFLFTYSSQFWYLQTALGYDRQFGKHAIGGKLMYDRFETIFAFDLPKTNQNVSGSATYDFEKKYFAEAAINYSGCDRYPPDNRFGIFYAAGLGWDVSQENFIKDNASFNWLNKFKIRSTYGKTGNDNVGYFTWRESFAYNHAGFASYQVYPFGTSRIPVAGTNQVRLSNPNVTWEKADKFNIGVDVEVMQNHFRFTADYYNNKFYDLLQLRGKQSAIIGIGYPLENLGIRRFTGAEFSATYQNNVNEFNYFITGNATFEKSKILFIDEIEQRYPWNERTGQPVDMIYGYQVDGFIETSEEAQNSATVPGYTLQTGDLKLSDLNNDGIINNFDITPIGTDKPLFYYGITAGFSFKGFDVSMLFQGVENRRYLLTDPSFGSNGQNQAFTYIIGRWTPETAAAATYPRLTSGWNQNNDINPVFGGGSVNSFWVHSGDYFRIKNVDIGYTLPTNITTRMKVSSLRVFVNGLNLFTYAEYGRVDPEVTGQVYPIQRVINFGVNVKL